MRLSAYLLLGDPRWLTESVSSYYSLVDRILAVCDTDDRAWDGTGLPVSACLSKLYALDCDHKVEVVRRDLVRPGVPRMVMDTQARSAALKELSGYDWVLQVDADEIVTSQAWLMRALTLASTAGASAVDYPARWILGRARVGRREDLYLEASDALGRVAAHYPGPIAVRPDVHLSYSRRAIAGYYRADLRKFNSYHEYTRGHPVHLVVPADAAIMHLSWVAAPGTNGKSVQQHGHRDDHQMETTMSTVLARLDHPFRTVATNALRASWGHPHRLRLTRLDLKTDPPSFRARRAPSR